MKLDPAASAERAQQATQQREALAAQASALRRAEMTPHEREADDAAARLNEFRTLLAAERRLDQYKAGSTFDGKRADFLKQALTLNAEDARRAAAGVLRESYKFTDWPGKKERKQEVKASLNSLDGLA